MPKFILGRSLKHVSGKSPWLRNALWGLDALPLGVFWFLSALMPVEWASGAGRRLMRLIGPRLSKQRHTLNNLAIMFPDYSEEQRAALAREVWGNFGAVFAEYPHLRTIAQTQADRRMEIINTWGETPFPQPDKAAVFVTPHLGNWELAASSVVSQGYPLTALYTPLSNPLVGRMLLRRRQQLGCRFLAKGDSIRAFFRELSSGRSVGMLPDLRIDEGPLVPFFGVDAPTTDTPARLALRFKCDLIPIRIERLPGVRFRVTFHQPLTPDDPSAGEQAQALQMTRKLQALFETWIREHPEQWLCTKRRWPKGAAPKP